MNTKSKIAGVVVASENPLKQMLVEYVGKVLRPEDEQVTVEMIVQTLASEFPEFLLQSWTELLIHFFDLNIIIKEVGNETLD